LRKKELLAEIGGEGLNDWENWLKKYYSSEIDCMSSNEFELFRSKNKRVFS